MMNNIEPGTCIRVVRGPHVGEVGIVDDYVGPLDAYVRLDSGKRILICLDCIAEKPIT
jgi:hypothetical protein